MAKCPATAKADTSDFRAVAVVLNAEISNGA